MHLFRPGIGKHSTARPLIKTVKRIAKFKQAGDRIDICITSIMAK